MRKYLERTKIAFGQINPHHKFLLSVEFSVYVQKYYLLTSPRPLTLYTERRWRKRKEIIAAIMMLYKNMKVKVCSWDGDTDYFDFVADVLQGDTLAP